jgi:hypothetical protein
MKDIITAINLHFQNNWRSFTSFSGEIQYGDTPFDPSLVPTDNWIRIDIYPLLTTNGVSGNTYDSFQLFINAYHRNQIQATAVMDEIISFAQNTKIQIPGKGAVQILTFKHHFSRTIVGDQKDPTEVVSAGTYRIQGSFNVTPMFC